MDKGQRRVVKLFVRLLKAVYQSEKRAGYNYTLRTRFIELLVGFHEEYPTLMTNSMFYEIVGNLPDA